MKIVKKRLRSEFMQSMIYEKFFRLRFIDERQTYWLQQWKV